MGAYLKIKACDPRYKIDLCFVLTPRELVQKTEWTEKGIYVLLDDRGKYKIPFPVYEYIVARLLHNHSASGICCLDMLAHALEYWQDEIVRALDDFRRKHLRIKSSTLKEEITYRPMWLAAYAITCYQIKPDTIRKMAESMTRAALRLHERSPEQPYLGWLLMEQYHPDTIPLPHWMAWRPTKWQARAFQEVGPSIIERAVDLAYIHDKTDPKHLFV